MILVEISQSVVRSRLSRRLRKLQHRELGLRILAPDREILGRHREPAEPVHIAARFDHASGLLPSDLSNDLGPCRLLRTKLGASPPRSNDLRNAFRSNLVGHSTLSPRRPEF